MKIMRPRISANKHELRKNILILHLLLATCCLLPAAEPDFGLAINQYAAFNSKNNNFEYRADIIPRFSLLFADTGSFIVSGGITLGIEKNFYYVPELLKTEFAMRFGSFGLKIGRTNYNEPLNFILDGLLDGFQITHTSLAGKFGLGLWYTGFLYKKNANITMTPLDQSMYELPLNYSDFVNTYFAPRRLIAALDWEHLAIGESVEMKAALIGQIDLNNTNNKVSADKLHTQYFVFKTNIPAGIFVFELGGSVQTAQLIAGKTNFNVSFAGMGGINLSFGKSRLSLNARYASGETGSIGAFVPVTGKYYGQIFQPKMTALTVVGLNYTARILQTFGASLNAAYFIRNDKVTPNNFSIAGSGSGGNFLGAEFFARIIWSPVSDVQLNLGGGAFIPALGNNWRNDKTQWRVDLTAALSIF